MTTNKVSSWLGGFPGMAWRVELTRSRMEVLNPWTHPLLGADTARLIKDRHFCREVVCREDIPLLWEYQDVMTGRQPGTVNFHLKAEPDTPLLIQGWPDPENTDFYYGLLKYSFLPVPYNNDGISGMCQMSLSRMEYPVLLVDVRSQALLRWNEAARQRFAPASNPDAPVQLADIAPNGCSTRLMSAVQKALTEDIWAGSLMFRAQDGKMFTAKVRISPCSGNPADEAVRIALLALPDHAGVELAPPARSTQRAAIDADTLLREGLQELFSAAPMAIDGLMFSDIQSPQGQVEVYGTGPCFTNLAWGAPHDYEGTIAQDIEHFGLPALMVEDTRDSIKSIDWVMFIPHGVLSYYALPLFNTEGLHAVLIFASTKPNFFTVGSEGPLCALLPPFAKLIAQWRQRKAAESAT